MSRRIVQIAVSPAVSNGESDILYALTDSGEIWQLIGARWSRVQPLPEVAS
jgi:hypothetical protein